MVIPQKKEYEMLDRYKQQMFTSYANPNVHKGRPGNLGGCRGIKIAVHPLSPCTNKNSAWPKSTFCTFSMT